MTEDQTDVLLIDADPTWIDALSAALAADGVRVVALTDPDLALVRAPGLGPDVVLLDLARVPGGGTSDAGSARVRELLAAVPGATIVVLAAAPGAPPLPNLDALPGCIWIPRTPDPSAQVSALHSLIRALVGHVRDAREVDAWYRTLLDFEMLSVSVHDLDGNIVDINPTGARWLGYIAEDIVGQKIDDLIAAQAGHDAAAQRLEALRTRGRIHDTVLDRTGDNNILPLEISAHVVPYHGRPIVLSIASSLREREEREKKLATALTQVATVREIALELAAELDIDRLLRLIVERAIDLTRANGGGFYLYDPEQERLVRSVSAGAYSPPLGTTRRRNEGLAGRVWALDAPVIVDNYLTWEGHADEPNAAPARALGVPICSGGEFLGVLSVSALPDQRAPFTEEDADLLELVATHAAIALHNARLYTEANELRTFNEQLVNQMAEGLTLEEPDGTFSFYNPAGAHMLGYTVEELIGAHLTTIIPPDEMDRVAAANSRRMRAESDSYELTMLRKDGSRLHTIVSGAPRFDAAGNFAGSLVVTTDIEARVEAEQALLHRVALEHALTEISTGLIDVDPEQLDAEITGALRRAAQAVDAELSFLFLFDKDGATIDHVYGWDDRDPPLDDAPIIALRGTRLPWWTAELERTGYLAMSSLGNLPPEAEAERRLSRVMETESTTAMALYAGGRLRGFLGFASAQEHTWPSSDVALLKLLGEIVGSALDRREATRILQQQAERLAFGNRVGRAISATLDPTSICRILHAELRKVIDCPHMIVTLFDEQRQELTALHVVVDNLPFDVSKLEPLPLNPEFGPHGRAITTRQPVIVADLEKESKYLKTARKIVTDDERTPRSLLTAPMVVEHRALGTIQVQSYEPGIYTAQDAELVGALANQVGLALQNARLLARARDEAQRLHEVMYGVPEGVVLVASTGEVLLANPAGGEALGALADAGVGDTLDVLGGHTWEHWLTSPPTGRWHEITVDGPPRLVFELLARPVARDQGDTAAWVMVVRDVTERRAVDARAQQQERLAAVGQLAAGIAHDFNNVMAVIVLYAQLARADSNVPPNIRLQLQTIVEQAHHASAMIQQILDFSRSSVLTLSPMDLAGFLKEQAKLMRRVLPDNLELIMRCEVDAPAMVDADPTRIQQAIMNLAVNARDAMPDGGAVTIALRRLTVRHESRPPLPEMHAGEWLELSIADTGAGISEAVLPHIFEPFFTTKGPGRGNGLGLAQVHGIVKQHGGEAMVTSTPGQGTIFTLYLPALRSGSDDADRRPGAGDLARGHGEVILVVEDNATTRASLVDALRMLGYRTIEAGNGHQALALLTESDRPPVDLIVSDLVMPVAGGKALAESLRRNLISIPMIILSGHALTSEITSLRTLGVRNWIQKPVDLTRLAEVVAETLLS